MPSRHDINDDKKIESKHILNSETIAPNIQVFDHPFTLMGAKIDGRMTVIKRTDNTLWLHSVIPINDEIIQSIEKEGDVSILVIPNLYHHLNIRPFISRYPDAQIWAPNDIEKKTGPIKHISLDIVQKEKIGHPDIEMIKIEGMPRVQEYVFFHRHSQTLIATDLLFNIQQDTGISKWILKLYGAYQKCGPTALFKGLIKDKRAFNHSIEQMLKWDFNTVILAHGQIIRENGREKLKRIFSGR